MAHQPKPATVAAYQTLRATRIADTDATFGAQIGVNLFLPNGNVAQMGDFGTSGTGSGNDLDTTDDLNEGGFNLYYTTQRAQDAVGGILTDTATIDFTYNQTTHSITADLKTLANTGGGSLVKIARDAYGLVSGTSAATTNDLPEGSNNLYFTKARVAGSLLQGSGITLSVDGSGNTTVSVAQSDEGQLLTDWADVQLTDWSDVSLEDWSQATSVISFKGRSGAVVPATGDYTSDQVNEGTSNLYFTAARVRAVVITGLSVATNAAITATDTILSALGKLQAQITARQVIGQPVSHPEYTLATLPSAASNKGSVVICTDLVEGYRPVFSDGTNWLRFTNNTVAN